MKSIFTILLFPFVLEIFAQSESIEKIVLRPVTYQDTLAKYASFIDNATSTNDMKAHELIWALKSVREVAIGLQNIGVGMETFTMILERPNDKTPYFVLGLYERQTQTLNKLMTYRIDSKRWTIDKKNDWETEWKTVED